MDFLNFLNEKNNIWVYFIIFFGKIIEVTVATIRMVLINRGERTKGSIIAFFEVTIWIIITGTVLTGFSEDVLKIILYCFAFAVGNYIGSYIEGKIALGLSTIQVISSIECAENLVKELRNNNLAVTVMDGEGKEGDRKILMIHLKRNRIAETVKLINNSTDTCVITVTDVKVLRGGYIKK